MSIATIDKRFALIAKNGDVLFPYKKRQTSTGRYGFAVSAPGEQDRHGGGDYLDTVDEVIKRLVFEACNARVTTINKPGRQRAGTLGIGKRVIVGYWIAEELKHLVKGADVGPLPLPPRGI